MCWDVVEYCSFRAQHKKENTKHLDKAIGKRKEAPHNNLSSPYTHNVALKILNNFFNIIRVFSNKKHVTCPDSTKRISPTSQRFPRDYFLPLTHRKNIKISIWIRFIAATPHKLYVNNFQSTIFCVGGGELLFWWIARISIFFLEAHEILEECAI